MINNSCESLKLTKAILKELRALARQVNPEIAKDIERICDDVVDLSPMIQADLQDAYDAGYSESFEVGVAEDTEKDGWGPEDDENAGHC